MSAAAFVGSLMAGTPGELVGIEWRGEGAILTFEYPGLDGGPAGVFRVQVDAMFGRRADDAARPALTLVPAS